MPLEITDNLIFDLRGDWEFCVYILGCRYSENVKSESGADLKTLKRMEPSLSQGP